MEGNPLARPLIHRLASVDRDREHHRWGHPRQAAGTTSSTGIAATAAVAYQR
jgi:hypothetical protein